MFKFRKLEKGQGLGEYALILSLVALVSIAAVMLFGDQLVQMYCKIAYAVDPALEVPLCERLSVSCSGMSGGTVSGNVRLEAVVNDTVGEDDTERVQFYIDGAPRNTEYREKYCLQGGDASCSAFNTRTLPNGQHTFRAVAYDKEGNSGYCEVTVNVQN